MSARTKMMKLWKRSRFDQDCKSIEEFSARVAGRLKIAFGIEVEGIEEVWNAIEGRIDDAEK